MSATRPIESLSSGMPLDPVQRSIGMGTIQRWRTFAARVTCAVVAAVAGLNMLVTGSPPMTELSHWPATLSTAAALFGISYLAVCAAEFLLGLVMAPPRL
jgi:hypothetical protein